MNPALLFLIRRSFVNAFRERIRRLRQPRYLAFFVVGLVYFALVFGPWNEDGPFPASAGRASRGGSLAAEWAGGALLLLLAVGSWLLPARGPALAFLEPEVAFLFPAPLRRKELVRFKLLDTQKVLVPMLGFFALVFGLRQNGEAALRILLGGLLVLNVFQLYSVGVRLTRASLVQHGAAGWKRQGIVVAALAALGTAVALTMPPFPGLAEPPNPLAPIPGWLESLGESPAGLILLPFRLPGMMYSSPDLPSFLVHAGYLAGLLALLYLWVEASDAAFEEAAADHAVVLARRIAAVRKGNLDGGGEERKTAKRSLFRLAPTGPPETAFLWKTGTEMLRHVPVRLVMVLLMAGIIAIPIALDMSRKSDRGAGEIAAIATTVITAFLASMLVFVGPTLFGGTLRGDLEVVETLKTLPVTGARIVRSYLAGTVLAVAAVQAVLVVLAALVVPADRAGLITPAWRVTGALAALLVLPALTAVSAVVDAAAVLYFPAWVRPGQAQVQGGMEGMGYGILSMIGKVVFLGLGGGIPLAIGGAVIVGAGLLGIPALLPAAALVGAALAAGIVLLEVHLACGVLGRRFEDLDPSKEGMLQ